MPRSGKAVAERNPPRAQQLVEEIRHRPKNSAFPAEAAHRGIRRHIADGVAEPGLSVEKHPRPPSGVVPNDLFADLGDDSEPAVRVLFEFPAPLFGRHLAAEDAREKPPDPRRILRRRGPNAEAAHDPSRTNVSSGRPSEAWKTLR